MDKLTNDGGHEIQPGWLPDGRLVFTALAGNQSGLRWLDPAHPKEVHVISLSGENPRNPTGVR